MPVCNKRNVIFVHIPKCAGTSIEVALGWASAYPRIGREITKTVPNFMTLFGGDLQHLTIREIAEYFLSSKTSNYFCFAIVRNPFDRLASHFLWKNYRFKKVDQKVEALRTDFRVFVDHVLAPYAKTQAFTSPRDGYLHCGVSTGPSLAINSIGRHLMPQCSYLFINGQLCVDKLIACDDLNPEWALLRKKIADLAPLEVRMKSEHSFDYTELYDDPLRSRVTTMYEADFALYESLLQSNKSTIEKDVDADFQFAGKTNLHSDRIDCQGEPKVPNKIFMYWHQGWEHAPFVVKRCLHSITKQNPQWEINLLDANSVSDHVDIPEEIEKENDFPLCALSDIIRIELLNKYGGVWMDATIWCHVPLRDWLNSVCKAGFFAFSKPNPGLPLSSWFLAATTDSYIIRTWRDATRQLWDSSQFLEETRPFWKEWTKSEYYFWFHNLFQDCLDTHKRFKTIWNHVPTVSADGPHYLQHQGLLHPLSTEAVYHIATRQSSVYKLTHKISLGENIQGTNIGFLLKQPDIDIAGLDPGVLQSGSIYQLSVTRSIRNEVENAIDTVKRAIALNTENALLYHHLGNLLFRSGDIDGAESAQLKAMDRDPEFSAPHVQLSRIYSRKNDIDKAVKFIKKAIQLKDDDPNAYHHLGNLLFRNGDLDGAESAQLKAMERNPDIPGPYAQLSRIFSRKNDIDTALRFIKKAVKRKDDDPNAYHLLGNLLLQKGDLDGAESAQLKAVERNPDIPGPYAQLSHIEFRKKNIDKAIVFIEKAIELKKDNKNFYHHLGNLRQQIGDSQGAKQARQTAEDLN